MWWIPLEYPKTLGPLEGVLNKASRIKSLGKHDRDQTIHLWSWIEKPIALSSKVRYLKVAHTLERWLIMWVSLTMVKEKHVGNQTIANWKSQKWAKANKGSPKGPPWGVPMVKRMMTSPSRLWSLYKKEGLDA
jgi:hypothetical protein